MTSTPKYSDPQTVWPRIDGRVDYGARRRVLVYQEHTGYYLAIIQGHQIASAGVRGFGREYVPARLSIYGPREERVGRFDSHTLAEGRISRRTIMENRHTIDDVFGVGTAENIDLLATLELP